MRTNILAFVLGSENRKKIVETIFEYPDRQWSCSALEDTTKLSHATVFRTLDGLREFGILKSTKINKKDILYELVEDAPLAQELKRLVNIEKITAKNTAKKFVNSIKKEILSAILYGSSVKGGMKPGSDIDILIILDRHNTKTEKKIQDTAGEFSSRINKTISVTVIDTKEAKKDNQFMRSVKADMEVIYGKKPFWTS